MNSTNAEFCDTNIIVYAYDASAGAKRRQARQLLDRLWESGNGAASIQILQELFVTLTRKIARPLVATDARAIVEDLATWQIFAPAAEDVLEAIDAAGRWQLSFWDAMIVTAAKQAGAAVLWSEDLSHGQDYGGIVVLNPFLAPAQL